jgi:hypothetical protein
MKKNKDKTKRSRASYPKLSKQRGEWLVSQRANIFHLREESFQSQLESTGQTRRPQQSVPCNQSPILADAFPTLQQHTHSTNPTSDSPKAKLNGRKLEKEKQRKNQTLKIEQDNLQEVGEKMSLFLKKKKTKINKPSCVTASTQSSNAVTDFRTASLSARRPSMTRAIRAAIKDALSSAGRTRVP